MALRWFGGAEIRETWTPLERVAPAVPRTVIASEDNLFCEHAGFDWQAIGDAADDYTAGKRLRGASTISIQVAKNLFLWPSRDFVRRTSRPLTPRESALLAAVLPNPREWSPDRPTPYIAGRADVITRRVGQLGPLLACVGQH